MIKYTLCYYDFSIEEMERKYQFYDRFNTIYELFEVYKNFSIIDLYKIAVMKGNNCIEFIPMDKYISLL